MPQISGDSKQLKSEDLPLKEGNNPASRNGSASKEVKQEDVAIIM